MGQRALPTPLAELRALIERADGVAPGRGHASVRHEAVDRALPGQGLALGALHEIFEGGPRGNYAANADSFRGGNSRALARAGAVVPAQPRSLRACARTRRAASRSRHLLRDLEGRRDSSGDGRRRALRRACRRRGRVEPARADALAAASTRGGALRRHRARRSPSGCEPAGSQRRIFALAHFGRAFRPIAKRSAWAARAGMSNFCAAGGQSPIPGFWRHAMRRVVSLFLPSWSTDRAAAEERWRASA